MSTPLFSRVLSLMVVAPWVVACGPPAPPPDSALVADPPPSDTGGAPGAGLSDLDRGVAYVQQEEWTKAKEHFEKAVAAMPKNGEAKYYLALTQLNLGDADAAEQGFKEAIALKDDLYLARAQLGGLYVSVEPPRAKEAIEVLLPALDAIPDKPEEKTLRADVEQILGFAYRVDKDYAASQKHYEASLAVEDNPQIRFALADMLVEAKKNEAAAAELRKFAESVQDDPKMLAAVARMFARTGAPKDCVKSLDRAIELKPDVKTLLIDRGRCKLQAKDPDAARTDFMKAIEMDNRFQDAYFFLGLSYLESNKRLKAVEAFQQAIRIDKTSKVGQAAQKRLDELK